MNKCRIGLSGPFQLIGYLVVCISCAFYSLSPVLASSESELIQNLTPDQKQAIINKLGKESSLKITQPVRPPDFPVLLKPKSQTDSGSTNQDTTGDGRLKQFGYDLFSGVPTTFAPATDIPIPADYIVGPGDTVLVQLFGKENVEYELVITRDGRLMFPGIGPISVAGMKFSRLQQVVEKRVNRQFIGVRASVTLGKLRSIRVFVLGDAVRPGSYTVSGLSNLTNALFASGGIRKIGSLRDIQLKRRGKVVAKLDLYDLLLKGDTSNDKRLLPGDVIFIPPIRNTVGIRGEVRRPAIYELKNEKTVGELINLAGGFLPSAYPEVAKVDRIDGKRERILLDLNLNTKEGQDMELVDGDVVQVYSVLDRIERTVFLHGHVNRPGGYEWDPGMKLLDLIPSLSVLKEGIDPHYIMIKRENPDDRTISLLDADLEEAMKNPKGDANILLHARDEIYVFSIYENRQKVIAPLLKKIRAQANHNQAHPVVSITGNVHHGGNFPLSPDMRVRDLLRAAGGTTETAYTLEAELTRYEIKEGRFREQSTITVDIASVLENEPSKNLLLRSYDHLVIRRLPKWDEGGNITLAGEFNFPGSLPIKRGERLSSLIQRAGGLTKEAYPEGAVFIRESVRQREQAFIARLADQLERDLAFAGAKTQESDEEKKVALAEGRTLLKQLRQTQATGRMVVDVAALIRRKREKYDLFVQPGDRLVIPRKPDDVGVLGEVYHPTSHLYQKGKDAMDYVKRSGGVTEKGNKRRIYVVHANGSVSPIRGTFRVGPRIGPGDTIIVPVKLDRISNLKLATDMTQVLYQVTVSLATLRTLGIF